jgi:hypothetical protein
MFNQKSFNTIHRRGGGWFERLASLGDEEGEPGTRQELRSAMAVLYYLSPITPRENHPFSTRHDSCSEKITFTIWKQLQPQRGNLKISFPSQRCDKSAAVRQPIPTSICQKSKNPCEAISADFTIRKKGVTRQFLNLEI